MDIKVTIKIAVPVTSFNTIDEHFGHCEKYAIYSLDKNEIASKKYMDAPQGCGCKSNISEILANEGVGIMLAGGIGDAAINVLNNSGIEVIRGCSGNADQAVKDYLSGKIQDSGESCQQHENHHNNDHTCEHH